MKWEYKIFKWDTQRQAGNTNNRVPNFLEIELGNLGQQGWELVSVINSKFTGSYNTIQEVTYTFKRPIEE
ncbi:DUF4177 domain-containing protein [Metasolibacillus meyeri]|uniref:DUF4177 domain-containing protein n=1 Tax=Metasolibacillus meyeri TaxID=1071052 RepID=A0AAW9NHI9_9BACL|nr:DUF4177 domain-containing protein [Metasolibacillus meyeri]MEC1177197.1 DUF4177 domain-containing protein [Metasolibacillus meyeri]